MIPNGIIYEKNIVFNIFLFFMALDNTIVVQINKPSHRSDGIQAPTVQFLKLLVQKVIINTANNEFFDLLASCRLMCG